MGDIHIDKLIETWPFLYLQKIKVEMKNCRFSSIICGCNTSYQVFYNGDFTLALSKLNPLLLFYNYISTYSNMPTWLHPIIPQIEDNNTV